MLRNTANTSFGRWITRNVCERRSIKMKSTRTSRNFSYINIQCMLIIIEEWSYHIGRANIKFCYGNKVSLWHGLWVWIDEVNIGLFIKIPSTWLRYIEPTFDQRLEPLTLNMWPRRYGADMKCDIDHAHFGCVNTQFQNW